MLLSFRTVFLLSLSFAVVSATPLATSPDFVQRSSTPNVPRGWTKLSSAPSDHRINLRLGLKQKGIESIRAHLEQSSDPRHPNYGNHLSLEELEALSAPSPDSLERIYDWLGDHGVEKSDCHHSSSKDWIHVNLPVSKIEKMLNAKYNVYQHDNTGEAIVRTQSHSVPAFVHDDIDVISPTNYFSSARRQARHALIRHGELKSTETDSGPVSKICNTSLVSNECLRTFYGTIDYKPQVPHKNRVGGGQRFLGETAINSDLQQFLKNERPDAVGLKYTINLINGGQNPQTLNSSQINDGTGIEAGLDTQTVFGVAAPIPGTFYSTGGSPPFKADDNTPTDSNEPYLNWLEFVLSQRDLPSVITTSYGDDEQTVPRDFAERVCHDFMRLGARGVSVLFASGDDGVGPSGTCFTNDGKNKPTFLPEFPTGCPFVTSVGATMNFNPEVAVSDTVDFVDPFFSGGGFSNYFDRPAYQARTVDTYLKGIGKLHQGLFNKNGRAYPDVAAQGSNFKIAWQGEPGFIPVGGTSASTPLFSSIVALLNDVRLARGRPTLGFLNPWLYAEGFRGLNDITVGSSAGCNTTGFPAGKGWDAVTGFGTPNFQKLRELVLFD